MTINRNYIKKDKLVSDLTKLNQDLLALAIDLGEREKRGQILEKLETLSSIIGEVQRKAIRDNSYVEAPKRMFRTGQRGQILAYMQRNPEEEVCSIYFSDKKECAKRGVQLMAWSSAGWRLSELARWGLIKESSIIPWKVTFNKKAKDRIMYKITEKGKKYRLA